MPDLQKARREAIRWQILLTLNNARPIGCYEKIILTVIQAEFPDTTQQEIRRELDYIDGRELVAIIKEPDGRWKSKLTRYGIDFVEYTIPAQPGIARPEKYDNA